MNEFLGVQSILRTLSMCRQEAQYEWMVHTTDLVTLQAVEEPAPIVRPPSPKSSLLSVSQVFRAAVSV